MAYGKGKSKLYQIMDPPSFSKNTHHTNNFIFDYKNKPKLYDKYKGITR